MVAFAVTTRAVVWIEIGTVGMVAIVSKSPPVRWCGLKWIRILCLMNLWEVTTRAVVWIEISTNATLRTIKSVTTRAVVWIEIPDKDYLLPNAAQSPPVRWCGLKSASRRPESCPASVTTRAVVWIEIADMPLEMCAEKRHHPCGGVD